MNERIKELAKQAGYYLYDLTETHEIKTVETDSTDEWITLQKFAELIVEECRYVMDCNKGSDQHSEWNRALFETSAKIKEHFGINNKIDNNC